MPVKEIQQDPAGIGTLLKAALPTVPVINKLPGVAKTSKSLPDLTLIRKDIVISKDHVAAYAENCGFTPRQTLPFTYPHMLSFGLQMSIMTDAAFPFPAIGSVHLSNSITQHRSIMATEKLTVNCQAANLRGHSKGRAYDLITKVSSGDELVWESVSTYLRPGKGDPDASRESDLNLIAGTGTEWKLPADLGRRYATISGDYNPIHLYPLTAKALGFNRQIAHGMWTLARCVATFDNRLATSATVLVEFRKPVFLPSKVAFGSKISETGIEFSLTNPKTGAAHLLGKAF